MAMSYPQVSCLHIEKVELLAMYRQTSLLPYWVAGPPYRLLRFLIHHSTACRSWTEVSLRDCLVKIQEIIQAKGWPEMVLDQLERNRAA